MTVQDPQIRLGWMTLSTLDDARRSAITGSTINGPNGSGQFYWVYMSTLADFVFRLGSTVNALTPSSLTPVVGILQDTPGPGLAGSVCVFGVTKAIAGSTTIARGTALQVSSTLGGSLVPALTGNGPPIGYALETPTALQQIFAVMLEQRGAGSS